MKFSKPDADIFAPKGGDPEAALERTTHLCIAAHQDDIEIFAYDGIIECFRRNDRSFTGVIVTDGAGSPREGPYAKLSDEEIREVRHVEQRNAAAIGDYGLQLQLRFASSEVKDAANSAVRSDLKEILAQARPKVLYVHNPFDKHDTHVAVFLRTIEAIRELPMEDRPSRVLGGEVWRALDWVLDAEKVGLSVDRYESLAMALLGVFDSQISGGKRYDLATAGRRLANATYGHSHAVDQARAISWAVDLTPLVRDDALTVEAFAEGYLDRFRADVLDRLSRMG